jgi:multidrug transporter EmrE-like cation transporter
VPSYHSVTSQTLLGSVYIFLTVALTVYGQMVLKWRMNLMGTPPPGVANTLLFVLRSLADVWVLSTYVAALVASFTWMAALTRFELSFAYPFMSLAFVFVLVLGILFFGESLTFTKVAGTLLVVAGLILCSR